MLDALGGVLCRCTGYRKIVEAVAGVAERRRRPRRQRGAGGAAVGARIARVDGVDQVTGASRFGADRAPADALHLRAIRSPHAHARFTIGDLAALYATYPGLERVLTAADVPGQNRYGIYATGKDQPVFADGYVRFRGEAVAALVGDARTVARIADSELPIAWQPLEPILDPAIATAEDAPAASTTPPRATS